MVLIAKGGGSFVEFAAVLSGILAGVLCFAVFPWGWILRKETSLTPEELKSQHPEKAWVISFPPLLGSIGTLVLGLGIIAQFGQPMPRPSVLSAFLVPLNLLMAFYAYAALIEILGGVSPIVPLGHSPRPMKYIVSKKVRAVGVYRIVLSVLVVAAYFVLLD